ncbi:MAG: PIG-L family deacetylase [Chlorobia bacterium]|nr:PIG-L family deacetylase [Fimbriimonadaceae bacterium]
MADVDPALLKRKRKRRRIIVYGTLIALIWGFWLWQPWEYDFIMRAQPHPHPKVDPDSSSLFAKGTKVLIVTAHPDDSEFYVGGTLAKLRDAGAEIWQVIITEGDKSYYGPFTDAAKNREVRRKEALEAARSWGGKNLVILGYPDGRLKNSERLVQRLQVEFEKFQPDYVLAFDYDYPPRMSHKDHRIAGQAVSIAVEKATSVKWLMRFSTAYPNYVVDISDYWPEKETMLKIHKSQFGGKEDRIVNMVEDRAVTDGEVIGTTYGEGFRVIKLR